MANNCLNNVIRKWRTEYDMASIQRGIIEAWLKKSGLSRSKLNRNLVSAKYLELGDIKNSTKIFDEICQNGTRFNIYDLETVFENFIDEKIKIKTGIVYTPVFIRDYLISNSIKISACFHNKYFRICDPACGSGGFLIRMAEILQKETERSYEEIFSENIFGIDINQDSIQYSRIICELFILSKGLDPSRIKFNLIRGDTLLSPSTKIFKRFGIKGGFDVIATNPPYVKIQNIDNIYREKLKNRFPIFSHGNYSFSILFFHAIYELLKPNGCAGIITQNNLFTSIAGLPTRKWAKKHKVIRRIVDFGDQYIFPNASAYTCLVFFSQTSEKEFEFASIRGEVTDRSLRNTTMSAIRFEDLARNKWRLAVEPHFSNLKKMEKIGIPLGQLTIIRVGLATLMDRVYLVDEVGGKCKPQNGLSNNHEIEIGITKPVIKVSDIMGSEDIPELSTRIIYPYLKFDNRVIIMPEKIMRDKYPNTYDYLSNNKKVLMSRNKGKVDNKHWYRWGRTQSMEALGPKLLTKTFNRGPNFIYCPEDQLFCNGYALYESKNNNFQSGYSLKFIQRILNSELFDYYMKLSSFQIRGGYQCYQKSFLERFHVPVLMEKQIDELMVLGKQEFLDGLCELYEILSDDILSIVACRY